MFKLMTILLKGMLVIRTDRFSNITVLTHIQTDDHFVEGIVGYTNGQIYKHDCSDTYSNWWPFCWRDCWLYERTDLQTWLFWHMFKLMTILLKGLLVIRTDRFTNMTVLTHIQTDDHFVEGTVCNTNGQIYKHHCSDTYSNWWPFCCRECW